ncbi:hypothetical protein V8C37DRAFT_395144 [Trichoderma ceciliae]
MNIHVCRGFTFLYRPRFLMGFCFITFFSALSRCFSYPEVAKLHVQCNDVAYYNYMCGYSINILSTLFSLAAC